MRFKKKNSSAISFYKHGEFRTFWKAFIIARDGVGLTVVFQRDGSLESGFTWNKAELAVQQKIARYEVEQLVGKAKLQEAIKLFKSHRSE